VKVGQANEDQGRKTTSVANQKFKRCIFQAKRGILRPFFTIFKDGASTSRRQNHYFLRLEVVFQNASPTTNSDW
jgi:hypothetical protein